MNTKVSELSPQKGEFLRIIADQVMNCIESHHKIVLMRKAIHELKEIQHKVSHDIRGPVGGIMGIAEVIEEDLKEGKTDEIPHFLDLIKNGGQSVLDLASDILSSYNNYELQTDESSQILSLVQLQKKLNNLYQPQAKSKSIDLNIQVGNENQELEFPKHNLMQIFGNLITNAVKFTPDNGSVEVRITLKETQKTLLTFKVSDNGIGMTKEQVFNILSDQPKTTAGTNNERGFGFGFQLARHLINNLNGDLTIDTEPSEGTTITVNIPVVTD
jgi:signal transduction histidine kinase